MMNSPYATLIYAGIFGIMLVILSWRIMRIRSRLEVMIGDGGERELNVAVRIQGNFVEYVPMALLLLFFNEAAGWNPWIIHLFGVLLLGARLAHVHGMNQKNSAGAGRWYGARVTLFVIAVLSLLCVLSAMGYRA